MKKLTVLILSFFLAVTFAACGKQLNSNNNGASQSASGNSVSESTKESSMQPSKTPTEAPLESLDKQPESKGGKTLVVYYSASGNTKAVAGYLAEAASADVFELVPEEPYSDSDLDWTDKDSRIVYEHENPDDRNISLVKTAVPNWDSYDTVFIGYPIWWGIAAWPVDDFIKANQFEGKTVIPFCTSSSSGLGESGSLLAKSAGTRTWLDGERFSADTSKEAIQDWVNDLGL